MSKLILASQSKNRQQALQLAKIPFTSVPADVDERSIQHPDINQRVIEVARAKVGKVAQTHQGWILGADGVNVCEGQILEKPLDLDEARKMIRLQSGKVSSFITGYSLQNTITGVKYEGVTESQYKFRELVDQEIETYITSEPVFTWAAAFSPLNSSALSFVEWMKGSPSEFAFSVPLEILVPIFRKEGVVQIS